MKRRNFLKAAGMSAVAISVTGFRLIEREGVFVTDCQTSTDMLGPFFRKNAPRRHDLTYANNPSEVELKVIGQVFGADCNTPLSGVEIDIWHCDHRENYDMDSEAYRCRGRITTDENGAYWYKTFVPPHYGGRPKHIHYLIQETATHRELVTQLYFKGDKKIRPNNWVKYPWDEKRIVPIYQNDEAMAEVRLDLYLGRK